MSIFENPEISSNFSTLLSKFFGLVDLLLVKSLRQRSSAMENFCEIFLTNYRLFLDFFLFSSATINQVTS